jgi:excinuclease ABC subunit C
LSQKSGVYQMLDANKKIIYVGKARDLKKRVSSYFYRQLDTKTQVMVAQITDIQAIITNNETEALLLEANLIKELKPRYNILLKDDKSYPFLYLNSHGFPRLDLYRGAKKKDGQYFGPYPSVGAVRDTLAIIQKLFQIRQCSDIFFNSRTRPCLQYQIKRCTAPCVGHVSKEAYKEQVQQATLFLEGKNSEIIDHFTRKMTEASVDQSYEKAAFYRDQIVSLRKMQAQQCVSQDEGDFDVVGVSGRLGIFSVSLLFVRGGRLIGHKDYFLKAELGQGFSEVITTFILQYYFNPVRATVLPERIIVSDKLEEKIILEDALQHKLQKKIVVTDRGYKKSKHWQQMVKANAEQALLQHLAKKNTIALQLEALTVLLSLSNPIERIECFDISHTGGESTVASCVVFGVDGARAKDYRRFNISDITPGDDYAAMRQAIERRYSRLKKENKRLPDLLLIDGGKGQLRVAVEVLEELQIREVLVLGVAKGPTRKAGVEELWLWKAKQPIDLPSDHHVRHLIQYVRDEAHRFAITAHRSQRAKKSVQSILERVAGVGPKRRQALLTYFGGMQALKKASVEEIGQVPGISLPLAQMVYKTLNQ